jgi:hypothetical protein
MLQPNFADLWKVEAFADAWQTVPFEQKSVYLGACDWNKWKPDYFSGFTVPKERIFDPEDPSFGNIDESSAAHEQN